MPQTQFKDPVRNINAEVLASLELVDHKVFPLPGGTGRRLVENDPRLPHLQPNGDVVTYYEHVATVRDKKANVFFVLFRQTMDALLFEQSDPLKYPEWLIKSGAKEKELNHYIYQVKRHPKTVPVMRSHEDWLAPVEDRSLFDTIAFFLLKQEILTDAMFQSLGAK